MYLTVKWYFHLVLKSQANLNLPWVQQVQLILDVQENHRVPFYQDYPRK